MFNRTKKEQKFYDIIHETYELLYKAATPSADFNELCHNCKYEDYKGNAVNIDRYLSDTELYKQQLRRTIPFNDYTIEEEEMTKIVQMQCKKYKLNLFEQQSFKVQIYLGCSPKFKK